MNWSPKRWSRIKKLALSEKARGELERQMELLKKVLANKEKEISEAKDWLRQAKEEAIHEYRDSNAFLAELRGSFAKGFDNCLHQVKASYPNLDLSNINIDAPAQTSVHPVHSKSTNELFAYNAPGNGEAAQVEDNTRHPDVQEENEHNSPVQ